MERLIAGFELLGCGAAYDRALADALGVGTVELVEAGELAADDLVLPVGAVGALAMLGERPPSGLEPERLRAAAERETGRSVRAVLPWSAGGMSGLLAVWCAGLLGLPVLDADLGARPPRWLRTMTPAPAGPCYLTSEDGDLAVLSGESVAWRERQLLAGAAAAGGSAVVALRPMPVGSVVLRGAMGSVLAAGSALLGADPVDGLVAALSGFRLVAGTVVDVEWFAGGGWALVAGEGSVLRLEFADRYLLALDEGRLAAATPDGLAVVDARTGRAVATDRLRRGLDVAVVAFACAPEQRSAGGLAVGGPAAFGYEVDYAPVESLHG